LLAEAALELGFELSGDTIDLRVKLGVQLSQALFQPRLQGADSSFASNRAKLSSFSSLRSDR